MLEETNDPISSDGEDLFVSKFRIDFNDLLTHSVVLSEESRMQNGKTDVLV